MMNEFTSDDDLSPLLISQLIEGVCVEGVAEPAVVIQAQCSDLGVRCSSLKPLSYYRELVIENRRRVQRMLNVLPGQYPEDFAFVQHVVSCIDMFQGYFGNEARQLVPLDDWRGYVRKISLSLPLVLLDSVRDTIARKLCEQAPAVRDYDIGCMLSDVDRDKQRRVITSVTQAISKELLLQ